MPITTTYKLPSFQRGEVYSASADFRRFVTVDYNMETFIGIVGVGIIDGWTVEHVNNTLVKILPGNGIVNGFYSESPYIIKKRSEMISGDREISAIVEEIPEPYLTPSEYTIYVNIILEYNPTFIPQPQIENSYVKVVIPFQLTLTDNSDNYIYAKRLHINPYPLLNDYPVTTMDKPNVNDYANYTLYLAALTTYNAQMAPVLSYDWQSNSVNHFTEVEFLSTTGTFIPSDSQILLAKVTTRNNSVIKNYSDMIIPKHKHGGSNIYDPPKINLETDIRNAILITYDNKNNIATFKVLEKQPTSIELGHKHTYYLNSDGDGYTVEQIGSSVNKHFHYIYGFIVQNQEYTINSVENHIHTISTEYDSSWLSTSYYEIYVNGNIIGDQTTTTITVDSVNKTISMKGILGGVYKTYSSSFTAYGKI